MQRAIKFRAWDEKAKEMVNNPVVSSFDWRKGTQEGGLNTLMQFIGLIDRNGIEVFEGDIVDISANKKRLPNNPVWRIGWDEVALCWCFVYETGEPGRDINNTDKKNMRVIGNIYEHPELLAGKQQS